MNKLEPGKFYHIYNRGNNRENLFRETRNYAYFLKLYTSHIEPVANTFAYCLLYNHFHLLVQVTEVLPTDRRPSQAFANLFNAYARAFNRVYGRTGALFQRPFGRIEVTTAAYRKQLVTYLHKNPQKHGLVSDFRTWPYSSYHTLTATMPTRLQRDEVLTWFGGVEALRKAHLRGISANKIEKLTPDDVD
ncbi:MAG: hypothetical protein WCP31_06190 [Chloroflexales bacterium]